jgi:protease PrsW
LEPDPVSSAEMQIQGAQAPRDRAKIWIGVSIYAVIMLIGGLLLSVFLLSDILSAKNSGEYFVLMLVGGGISFTAVLVYMIVPVLIDRYDPEPWWALLMAFAWGAVVATGFSGWINSIVGDIGRGINPLFGNLVGGVVSAPLAEEFWKGLLVAIIYFFLRREFDGVVDGVIYATFTALGFAAMENVLYYARAGMTGKMLFVVVLRGILSPWCHPLFTSMTGIGFGMAREAKSTAVKILAPIGGYMLAVCLHAGWNGSVPMAALVTGSDSVGALTLIGMILLFIVFMLAFTGLMIGLVVREGRIIRKFLGDEVLIGTLSREEMELVCSPFGRIRALFTRGGLRGRRFVGAAATLALKKWHTTRAMQGKKVTVSMDFIVPLRQELARIRSELGLPAPMIGNPAVAAAAGYGGGYSPAQPQRPVQIQQPYAAPAQHRPYAQPMQQQPRPVQPAQPPYAQPMQQPPYAHPAPQPYVQPAQPTPAAFPGPGALVPPGAPGAAPGRGPGGQGGR